jgi:hypothetical protein
MSDTFRKEYKPLSEVQKLAILRIKEIAEIFEKELTYEINHDNRMISLAKTNLEQAVMWAIKAIT